MKIPKNSKDLEPSLQFYPADWLGDHNLQSCSLEAIGLWINLMCIMHNNKKYGHLTLDGKIPEDKKIAKLLGITVKKYKKYLGELLDSGVPGIDEGMIYSKRMVADKVLREKHRQQRVDAANKRWECEKDASRIPPASKKPDANGCPSSSSSSSPSSSPSSSSSDKDNKDIEDSSKNGNIPYDEILKLWKKNCPMISQPRKLTDKRKNKIKLRWKLAKDLEPDRDPLEFIEAVFKTVAATPFLRGDNKKRWQADIDWIFESEENFLKISEGKYEGKTFNDEANRIDNVDMSGILPEKEG